MDSLTGSIVTAFVPIEPSSKMRLCVTHQNFLLVSPMTLTFLPPNSKIQKYSPTESAKVYDKAVNRKSNVHFNPRQTVDFIANNMAHATLTNDVKKRIIKQYLDVSSKATAYFLPVCNIISMKL